ncbi:MAG: tetratricopeptide repeat protein [Lewinellaceae bacterium]|nr:tetratricopeptide repeat protein [Lewinellaceae bacterium]
MQKSIFLLLLIQLPFMLLSAQPSRALQAANQSYQKKEYAEAIRQYEEILLEGYHSEALYYNLGNAYYRSGEFGRAILSYRRALKLDPGDENTLHNLQVAEARLPDPVGKIEQSGVVKAWLSVQNALSTLSWSIFGLVLLWLGGAGIAGWLLGGRPRSRKIALAGGVLLLVLSLFPFLLAYGRAQQEFFSNKAVIMVEQAPLRAAPEEDSQELLPLYEGVTVEVLDAIGSWKKVRLEDATEGWLPGDVLEGV